MAGFTAAAIAGSAIIGSMASSSAARSQAQSAGEATQAQRDIANQQTALQREQYLKQLELNEPFRQAGLTGQNMLLAQLQGGPYATAKFGGVEGYDPASVMRNFGQGDFQADPGYAFRLSEGMKGMNATAAARGGLLSGNALRAGQEYGQQMGSQEYQNAFNRYQANRALQAQEYGNAFNRFQTERTNTLAPLQSLAGLGQSATQQAQQASQNYATGAGNVLGNFGNAQASNIIGAGNARASGYVGGANAISSGVGQGLNFYQNRNLINQLQANRNFGGGGGGYTMPQPYSYGGADADTM
tara:strand:- start:1406 stop:2305 length:900 start_codon:yes stop_codon:yes gene_type:complete